MPPSSENPKSRLALFLEKASECRHPDAEWLTWLYPAGQPPVTVDEFLSLLEPHCRAEDARAMYFTALLGNVDNYELLIQRAAAKGYGLAEWCLATGKTYSYSGTVLYWTQMAASHGCRDALYHLGQKYANAFGVERDSAAAADCFRRASDLGHHLAQVWFAEWAFSLWDPERLRFLRSCHERGNTLVLTEIVNELSFWRIGNPLGACVLEVGRLLAGKEGVTCIANCTCVTVYEKARQCVSFYDSCRDATLRAISCWSIVGKRCGLVKDMRVFIAKLLWEHMICWAPNNECN